MFSVSLFSPYLFGSDQPVPEIGVISFIIVALILSAILYFASKMNTAQHPNLFRYIVLVGAFLAVSVNSVQCLMLIYAVPVQPPTAYPFLSGLLTIAFIPFSILGNEIETADFTPFGDLRDYTGSTASNYKFTDQEFDLSSGLSNYNARLYDPIIGRFILPDPFAFLNLAILCPRVSFPRFNGGNLKCFFL